MAVNFSNQLLFDNLMKAARRATTVDSSDPQQVPGMAGYESTEYPAAPRSQGPWFTETQTASDPGSGPASGGQGLPPGWISNPGSGRWLSPGETQQIWGGSDQATNTVPGWMRGFINSIGGMDNTQRASAYDHWVNDVGVQPFWQNTQNAMPPWITDWLKTLLGPQNAA